MFMAMAQRLAQLGEEIERVENQLVPSCLMWIVWTEKNRRSFEDTEKSLVQLQALCLKTLFDWSRCWGFSDCSTILEFISSLSIAL